jgi:phosphomevalonate kinase
LKDCSEEFNPLGNFLSRFVNIYIVAGLIADYSESFKLVKEYVNLAKTENIKVCLDEYAKMNLT